MRNGVILAGIAFAVALAVIVGNRLSNEAMAVVVGVVCGISASIPVSIGLVIAASHNWGRSESPREIGYDQGRLGDYESHRYAPQPPVVVITPPQQPSLYGFAPNHQGPVLSLPKDDLGQYYLPPNVPMQGTPREFKIVGEE